MFQNLKIYFANAAWMLTEKMIAIISSLTVGLQMIRYLGPAEYGKLAYVLSIVGIFSFFVHLGMNNILIKYFRSGDFSVRQVLGTAIRLRLFFGFVFLLIVNSIVIAYKSDLILISFILSSSVFLDIFFVLNVYFVSIEQPEKNSKAMFQGVLLSSFLKVLFIYLNLSTPFFAFAIFIENFFKYYVLKKSFSISKLKELEFSFELSVKILRESFPVLIAGIVVGLYMNVDVIMIEKFLDLKSVGVYSTGVKLVNVWLMIPTILSLVVFPRLIVLKRDQPSKFRYAMSCYYCLMFYFSIAIGFFMCLFSKFFIELLFKADFFNSIEIIKTYVWCIVFYFIGQATEKFFILNNKTKFMSYNALIGLFVNLSLNAVWIPRFGIVGAAYASVVATAYSSFLGLLLFRETREVFWEIFGAITFVTFLRRTHNG